MIKRFVCSFLFVGFIASTGFGANPSSDNKNSKTKLIFSIAPNNTSTAFVISSPSNFRGKALLCDNKGVIVQELTITDGSKAVIDLALLDANTYYVRVVDNADKIVFWQQLMFF